MLQQISNYSAIDLSFMAIIFLSAVLAFLNGAIKEALSLSKWILSGVIANKYQYLLDQYVDIQPLVVKHLVCFCLVFVLLSLVCQGINLLINQFIKLSGIGFLNKLLGMLFGFCRGVLLCSILTMIIPFVDQSYKVNQSKLLPVLSVGLNIVAQYTGNPQR